MRNSVAVTLLFVATPFAVHAVDRVVGVTAPSGGATLAKRVHVAAGNEVARIELVSNDLMTTFPMVRLRQLGDAGAGQIISEATNVAPGGTRHRFTLSIPPVTFVDEADVLVEVVLPSTNGVSEIGTGAGLGAMNLEGSAATSYIGSTATAELQTIDADLCVALLGPASAAKASARRPQDAPPSPAGASLAVTVSGRAGGDPEVEVTTPASAETSIDVFDVRGTLVRVLSRETLAAGSHRLVWDRRDARGQRVASGVYFVVARVAGVEAIRKTVVLY